MQFGLSVFNEKYVLLKAKFKVSRTLSFYLYRIYLPAICLVILSWANFWIPAKAVPARITMVVTNFLATVFILQGAAGQLAKREDPTAMEYFLVINVIFVLAVMVEYLLVLNYKPGKWFKIFKRIKQTFKTDGHEMKERPSNNRESGVEEPDQNRNNKHDTNVSSPEKDSYYHRIDNMSKLGFPLAYVLFNAIYFGYYRSVTKS